jgi:hypothetical protein
MIVKDHEKKACGFISVTCITVRAHVSGLPGPVRRCRDPYPLLVPAKLGWPAHAVALVPLATVVGGHRQPLTAGQ